MGAAFMSKFLSVIGMSDEMKGEENLENESEETLEQEENNYVFDEVEKIEDNIVEEEKEPEEEKSVFSFYKPKKHKEKEIEEYIPNISRRTQSSRVLPMNSDSTTKMIISQPQNFDSIKEIADYVKAKKSVIINLESVSHEDGRRIIDFLSGTAHALDGTIQKVSKLIFLVAPKDIEVQDDTEKYNYSNKLNMSWLKK